MTDTTTAAVERAERASFEQWLSSVHGLESTWQPERNCYADFPAHLAWTAWRFRTECLQASAERDALLARLAERPEVLR